jgi:DNA repair protein RadD
MRQTLRPFQETAIESLRDGVRRGIKGQLLVAPTGAGKTTIAAFLIESAVSRGGRVLFMAHRRELISQPSKRLDDMGIDHGIIMGAHRRNKPHLPVQIGSVQTLVNRDFSTPPSLVIIDEAHRARADTYKTVLEILGNPVVIGLTATPCRLDGRGLGGNLFQRIVECPQVADLTEMGFLVPAITFAGKKHNMSGYKKTGGDYNAEDVATEMNKPELIGDVVKEWMEKAAGRQTIAFASTIVHSHAIVDEFRRNGIPAEHVDAKTPVEIRDTLISRLASGEIKVISNVGIYDEGVDCPSVSCIIDASITASLVKYLQRRGRGLRPHPGKSDCIILDHAGNVYHPGHGLPNTKRVWELEIDKAKKKSVSPNYADLVKVCPKCSKVYDTSALTCTCGYVFSTRKRRDAKHSAGELKEITDSEIKVIPEQVKRQRYAWYLLQQHTQSKRSGEPYSKGFAFMKYQSEFRERPKRGWREEWASAHADLVAKDQQRRSLYG